MIVPVHNGEDYLAEAIRSVLDQSYQPRELIVVDDGSTDGTWDVLRRLRGSLRCVRQPHRGTAAAVNRGIAESSAEFISFLDADDLWMPDKLERQIAAFGQSPELDAVLGHLREFQSPDDGGGQPVAAARTETPMAGLVRGTMLIRREALDGVGPFDTRWTVGEFVDWYARAMETGLRTLMLPETVLLRRIHARNGTLQARDARIEFTRIARAALHRRRRGAEDN